MGRRTWLLLLSSIVLFLVFIFGLGRVADIADLARSLKQAPPTAFPDDKTPPAPPGFVSLPAAVTQSKLKITGRAEVESRVKIYLNDALAGEIKIDDTSMFSVEILLPEGKNSIWATATDPAGNTSEKSPTQTVIYDTKPPVLAIETPQDGASFTGTDKTINIEGKISEEAKITINDRLVKSEEDGTFSLRYTLSEGTNTLTVTAVDLAENKTEKTITVQYTP